MENILSFYQSMPPVTRIYITACVLTTLGVQLDLISPFQLYFNFKLIFFHHQYWRLITTFLFFGTFSFTFMFNIMFTYRYSRMLEEGSFRSNSADFFFMLLFGAILMILIAPFVKLLFLGHAFTIMLVYIWAKRNTHFQLSLFGLFNFRAPHLPWILLGFSLILGNSVLTDVLGISIGHTYYYLQDVFPYLPGGFRFLKTPKFIVYLFNPSEYYVEQLNRSVDSTNQTNEIRNLNEIILNQRMNETNQNNQSTSTQSETNRENENLNEINGTTKIQKSDQINKSTKESDETTDPVISVNASTDNELNESIDQNKSNHQSLRNRTENRSDKFDSKSEDRSGEKAINKIDNELENKLKKDKNNIESTKISPQTEKKVEKTQYEHEHLD